MNNTSPTKRTAEDAAKAWMRAQCEHDPEALAALLAPELVGSGPYFAGERIGKEDYVKASESFHQAFPNLKMEPTSMLSQGDTVAWEYVESATFTAPLLGPGGHTLAPTNRSYRVPIGAFMRINASGLIVELRVYDNPLLASQQLGTDPTVFLPNKAQDTVKAFIGAFNAHDLDAFVACLAPEFVAIGQGGDLQGMNKETYAKTLERFYKAIPDAKWELISILPKGNLVITEIVESGTFKAPWVLPGGTLEPTNRSYRIPGAGFFRVDAQGLIVEVRDYGNRLIWCQQLGIDPRVFIPGSKVG